MVSSRFLGEAAHHDVHGGVAHDVGWNSQVGSRLVNSRINLCDSSTAQGLSFQMLIGVGRLKTGSFSSFSMLLASPGELVRLVRLMEARHYKQAVIDEKKLALANLHSCMMGNIGDSDMRGTHASMRLAEQAPSMGVLQLAELILIPKLNAILVMNGKETDWVTDVHSLEVLPSNVLPP
jgi:hypothetical protein